ncbi:Rz1-like lysis system protein LysC [Hafnia paralvei]|uniref:Rz1-like lysis system protein LysC n=1 Tax=Hafnia paralvei TaxID=546367 RepID=UPI00300C93DA
MKIKLCAIGISLLCLMTLQGCIPAPPLTPPTLIYVGCPRLASCPIPGILPKTNGDLSEDNRQLVRALASCALQVETVKQCQESHDVKAKKST